MTKMQKCKFENFIVHFYAKKCNILIIGPIQYVVNTRYNLNTQNKFSVIIFHMNFSTKIKKSYRYKYIY